MTRNELIVVLAALALLASALLWGAVRKDSEPTPPPVQTITPAHADSGAQRPSETSPPKSAGATITLVVLANPRDARDRAKEVLERAGAVRDAIGEEVELVLRVAPEAGDEEAHRAACAITAAERQGRARDYALALLGDPASDENTLIAHARALALDVPQFDRDRSDPQVREAVGHTRRAIAALGLSTPKLLLNGLVVATSSAGELRRLADRELSAAEELGRRGVPRELFHEARARAHTGATFETYWQGLIGRAALDPEEDAEVRPSGAMFDERIWKAELSGREPSRGNPQALVTIVELGEFTCAWCARASAVLEELLDRYPNDVRVVWKTVTLPSHVRSRACAEAALTAHERGKFWQMHARIFANPSLLADADLARHAQELGIEREAVLSAIHTRRHQETLDANEALARRLDVRGAPNFFVNGRVVRGFVELEELEPLVQEELAKARRLVSEGTAPGEVYSRIMARAQNWEPLSRRVYAFNHQGRPFRGAKDGALVITQLVDYEFYPSADWDAKVTALLADPALAARVKVVVKQLPHVAHPLGRKAAEIALAANEQGKFWQMHEKLLSVRGALRPYLFESFAAELGLDMERFRKFIQEERGREMLAEDLLEGRAAGKVSGPALFIGGRRIEDEAKFTAEELRRLVVRQLAERHP